MSEQSKTGKTEVAEQVEETAVKPDPEKQDANWRAPWWFTKPSERTHGFIPDGEPAAKPRGFRSVRPYFQGVEFPCDMNGTPYKLGGQIMSPRFGTGYVLGIASGVDGRVCIVASFHGEYKKRFSNGTKPFRWQTWLVPADEGIALNKELEDKAKAREQEASGSKKRGRPRKADAAPKGSARGSK